MATYKVIQDIEAEDKLLGPLTLRQFIYAIIVVVTGFIAYRIALVNIFVALPFLLPMGFFGLLAAPFGHDQSSEVWLLAKIRFMLKPRRRIWDQSGVLDLVTVNAPKKVEHHLTDGLSQTEVKSRLDALAKTLDSRGWAVKNVNVNLFSNPTYLTADTDTDRLVTVNALPQDVPTLDVGAADDIMDEHSNPTAQHLQAMIDQSEQAHRQTVVATAQGKPPAHAPDQNQPPADYWFLSQSSAQPAALQPGYTTFADDPVVLPGVDNPRVVHAAPDSGQAEQQLLGRIHDEKAHPSKTYRHLKTLQPLGHGQPGTNNTSVTPAANPDILRLARNDDFNVATIQREANKKKSTSSGDEVVVSLH